MVLDDEPSETNKKINKNLFGDDIVSTHKYLYGGTEFEAKVGLMIYLNDKNRIEFDELLKSYKSSDTDQFVEKVMQLNIFKLFLKTPPDNYKLTTKGDGYCMLRMAYQIVQKNVLCQTYIDKEAWRKLDLDFNTLFKDIKNFDEQNESIYKLLEFINEATVNIQKKVDSNELNKNTLNWFEKCLDPVISTLKSSLEDKTLNPENYLPDDMFFHLITNKNITYALFGNITKLDDYTTEYGKIFSTIPKTKWLFLQWFCSQGEVYNNCSNDDGFTYEQIKTILTCGNNIQHTGIHYNWAGDFVSTFSSNFTTKAIKDFHICFSKLLCKMMNSSNVIPKNSIETMYLETDILNVLNSKLKPEAIVFNTLRNSLKDEETEQTTKEFMRNIESIQEENKIITKEKEILAQERDTIQLEFTNLIEKIKQDEAVAVKRRDERRQKFLKAQKEIEELKATVKNLEEQLKTEQATKF